MMRHHVSGHGTTLSVPPDRSRAARRKEKREREKEKAEDDPKGLEEHSVVMNKRQDPEWRQGEDLVWWSKGKKGKKGL